MKSETAQGETQRPRPLSRAFLVLFAVAVMVLAIAGAGHAQETFNSVASVRFGTTNDFRSVDLGNTVDLSFAIAANLSGMPNDKLKITSITVDNSDFGLRLPASLVIPSGGSITIGVQFRPTSPGGKLANIQMTVDHILANGAVKDTLTSVPTLVFIGTGTLPSLTLSLPDAVTGGAVATGTVTLSRAQPPLGPQVQIASNSPLLHAPPPVTIPVNQTSASFTVQTPPVLQDTSFILTAIYGSSPIQRTITVRSLAPSSLTFSPNAVTGGSRATGTLTLRAPWPSQGLPLLLVSDNPTIVPNSSPITLPTGATSALVFPATNPVSSSTSVHLKAIFLEFPIAEADLVVQPANETFGSVASLTIGDPDFKGVDLGNTADKTFTVTHMVNGQPNTNPNDTLTLTKVSLTPTSGTGGVFSVTATPGIGVPFAGSTQVTVHFHPIDLGPQAANLVMTLTHQRPDGTVSQVTNVTTLGFSGTGTLPTLKPLTVTPNPVTGGTTATGSITLDRPNPPLGPTTVTFASDNPTAVPAPPPVTLPVGATGATFSVPTKPGFVDTTATLTATYGTSVNSTLITVRVLKPSALTFNPTSVTGGSSTLATVTLIAAAPAGGALVNLSSDNPQVVPTPGQILVPAGATSSGFFPIATNPVSISTNVTITASFAGNQVSALLTVLPSAPTLALQSLTASSPKLIGGDSVAFTVALNTLAPLGGALVKFSSSNPSEVPPPPDLLILPGVPAGRSLSVRTARLTSEQSVTITASVAGSSIQTTLRVEPLPLTQIAVVHPVPTTGALQWLIRGDGGTSTSVQFGSSGDLPVPGNYLGLAHAQIALYRPSTGQWHLRDDSGKDLVTQFGLPTDLPLPADYVGLGHVQLAVFRPAPTATSTAVWFILDDTGITLSVAFGLQGDIPVPADYLGLGFAQFAVYRASTQQWHLVNQRGQEVIVPFGQPNDLPAPADYLGTGHVQIAVYRPGTGEFVIHPDDGTPDLTVPLGVAAQANDVPAPGDYLGLGAAQIGVFRSATAEWFFRPTRGTGATSDIPFGNPGDTPVTAAFLPKFGM